MAPGRTRTAAAGSAAALILLLSACSGSGGSDESVSPAAGTALSTAQAPASGADALAEDRNAVEVAAPLARVEPTDRDIVRTAELTVGSRDVRADSCRAGDLVRASGGEVFDEATVLGTAEAVPSSSLTLKVPPARFDALLSQLAELGTGEIERRRGSEDVTEQVVDVESRLATQRASVARVRALLDRARTVGEVVAVEGEVAKREAELESLQARARALAGRVSMATITLRLVPPPAPGADPAGQTPADQGFLAGLRDGWDAFTATLTVALTVLGALLPFLVLGGVLAAVTVLLRIRLRVRRSAAGSPVG